MLACIELIEECLGDAVHLTFLLLQVLLVRRVSDRANKQLEASLVLPRVLPHRPRHTTQA